MAGGMHDLQGLIVMLIPIDSLPKWMAYWTAGTCHAGPGLSSVLLICLCRLSLDAQPLLHPHSALASPDCYDV